MSPNRESTPQALPPVKKKERRWKRDTLFARKCRALNKNADARVALTPSRVTRVFKEQSSVLKNTKVGLGLYANALHNVQRISKRSSELLALVMERRLAELCKALKNNATHAGRKTVKKEDYELYMAPL